MTNTQDVDQWVDMFDAETGKHYYTTSFGATEQQRREFPDLLAQMEADYESETGHRLRIEYRGKVEW